MIHIHWLFLSQDLSAVPTSGRESHPEAWEVDAPADAELIGWSLPVLRDGACDWISADNRVGVDEILWDGREGVEDISLVLSKFLADGKLGVGLFVAYSYELSDGRVIDDCVLIGTVIDHEAIASRLF